MKYFKEPLNVGERGGAVITCIEMEGGTIWVNEESQISGITTQYH